MLVAVAGSADAYYGYGYGGLGYGYGMSMYGLYGKRSSERGLLEKNKWEERDWDTKDHIMEREYLTDKEAIRNSWKNMGRKVNLVTSVYNKNKRSTGEEYLTDREVEKRNSWKDMARKVNLVNSFSSKNKQSTGEETKPIMTEDVEANMSGKKDKRWYGMYGMGMYGGLYGGLYGGYGMYGMYGKRSTAEWDNKQIRDLETEEIERDLADRDASSLYHKSKRSVETTPIIGEYTNAKTSFKEKRWGRGRYGYGRGYGYGGYGRGYGYGGYGRGFGYGGYGRGYGYGYYGR